MNFIAKKIELRNGMKREGCLKMCRYLDNITQVQVLPNPSPLPMSELSGYTIRTMTRPELDTAVEWAAGEGWNPGTGDAECFYRTDPDGFLVGLLDSEPVAAISVVRYGASSGFLGFYLVRPEYRGMGLGLRIWHAGLARLEGRTAGLDGVVAQQENYRKSGFVTAWRNIRYEGTGGDEGENNIPKRESIVPLSELPFEELLEYDFALFAEERRTFLDCWISRQGSVGLGITENGRIAGYGVIRPCRNGFRIGPLFADRPDLAEALFSALKAPLPAGTPLFLDIPQPNSSALEMAERHRMRAVFETARMYRGVAPELPLHRTFGITTFELG